MAQEIMTPMTVKRELRRIGDRIRAARLARNLPMQLVAERAMTTRQTVGRIEAGDPRVSFGTVLSVLNAMGLLATVADIASPSKDPVAEIKSFDLRTRRARLPSGPSDRSEKDE